MKAFNMKNYVLLFLLSLSYVGTGQIVQLPCQATSDVAAIDLDRKAWAGMGNTGNHSQGYLHNFTLPAFEPCKRISEVNILITYNAAADLSGLDPGCAPPSSYYYNFSTNCPSPTPASCPTADFFAEYPGTSTNQNQTYFNPPVNFNFGENLGIDIVPVMNTGCPNGQNAIGSGMVILDYDICITVTLVDESIDTPVSLGIDQTICPTTTITLDPGTYDSYEWGPNGEMTPTIDVNPSATPYTVTVTDVNGCTDTDEITISEFPTSPISFSPSAPQACVGGTVSVSVNETYTDYNWSNLMSGQTVLLAPGMHDVTITDNNNCTFVEDITVGSVPMPNAGNDNTLEVCNNSDVYNMELLLGFFDAGGTWSDDDFSGVDVNINPSMVNFSGIAPNIYNYTYTVNGDPTCTPDFATITVTVFEENDGGVDNNEFYCANPGIIDMYALISNPTVGGTWSGDIGGLNFSDPFNVDISSLINGVYNFTYSLGSSGPCSATTTFLTITIEDANAGSGDAITVCEGTQVDLSTLLSSDASLGGIFLDTDASTVLNGSIVNTTGLAGLTYDYTYLVGTLGGACGVDETIFTINIESSVTAGIGMNDEICFDQVIDLFDLITNEDSGGEFTDLNGSGSLVGNILTTSTISPGTYSYKYVVGDDNTCPKDSTEITLNIYPEATIDILDTEIFLCEDQCQELTIVLTGTANWQFPLEVYNLNDSLILTEPKNQAIDTLRITACNTQGPISYINDTLNLIADSAWILTIPMLSDLNCQIDSLLPADTLRINTVTSTLVQVDTVGCGSDTLEILGVMLFQDSPVYRDTVQVMGCDSITFINVTFQDADTLIIDPTLCMGDSLLVRGVYYNEATPYQEIPVINPTGCDSLIIVDLSFYPVILIPLTENLCQGDSIFLEGAWQFTDGIYRDTFQSTNQCDSITVTTVTIQNVITALKEPIICEGDSIMVNGVWFSATNTNQDISVSNPMGCDSLITVNLSFYPPIEIPLTENLCQGDSIFLEGAWQFTDGIYRDTFQSANLCDSITITTVTIQNVITALKEPIICEGDSIMVNGIWFSASNTNQDISVSNPMGCDSLITVNLSFYPSIEVPLTENICQGDSIFLEGAWQFTNGIYRDTFQSANLCDSITVTTVTIQNVITALKEPIICDGDSIMVNGVWFSATNTNQVISVSNPMGCDSLITVNLSFYPTNETPFTETPCQGDSMFLEGTWQFTDGIYRDTFQSINQCDSIVLTTVTFVPCALDITISQTDNLCAGEALGVILLTINSTISLPYTVTWQGQITLSNGMIEQLTDVTEITIPNLLSDTYTIEILDQIGTALYTENVQIIDANPGLDAQWNIVDSIICSGDLGSLSMAVSGGQSSYQYSWSPDVSTTNTANMLQPGEYSVSVLDANNCLLDTSITLQAVSPITVTTDITDVTCDDGANGQIEITSIIDGTGPFTLTANGETLYDSIASDLTVGLYDITIVDSNNCSAMLQEEVMVTVFDFPTYIMDYSIMTGDSIILAADMIDSSITYVWSEIGTSLPCNDCPEPLVSPFITTIYNLEMTNGDGCIANIEITVVVEENIIIDVFPNIFSPNNDGVNDDFKFTTFEPNAIGLDVKIYDRYGGLVHLGQTAGNNISWDGKKDGNFVASGVYVFVVNILLSEGQMITRFGDLTVID